MQATLQFNDRKQAQEFATQWAFKSLMGYSIGTDNTVKIYNITDELKAWIDNYVDTLNNGK